jgi:hypothetical protein
VQVDSCGKFRCICWDVDLQNIPELGKPEGQIQEVCMTQNYTKLERRKTSIRLE